MIGLQIKADFKKARRRLGSMRRQLPFAASVALNKTATRVQGFEKHRIRRDLHRPTKPVANSIRVDRSTKHNLTAAVFVLRPIARFLRYQIEGGRRGPRGRVEAVPVNVRLNQAGNIPGRRTGKIAKLVARPDTFVGTINGVAGIWQRARGKRQRNKNVTLLLAFERSVTYRRRFDFYGYAERAAARAWPREFKRAINVALRSAR